MGKAVIFPFAIHDIALCEDSEGKPYTSATIDDVGLVDAQKSGAIEAKDALDKHKHGGELRHVWMGLEPIKAQVIPPPEEPA